jgi:hypothetical protein
MESSGIVFRRDTSLRMGLLVPWVPESTRKRWDRHAKDELAMDPRKSGDPGKTVEKNLFGSTDGVFEKIRVANCGGSQQALPQAPAFDRAPAPSHLVRCAAIRQNGCQASLSD